MTAGRGGGARRFVVALAVLGAAVGTAVSLLASPAFGPLIGWDVAAGTYLGITWRRVHGRDAEATRKLAAVEDPTRGAADLVLLAAAVASLLAVGLVIANGSSSSTAKSTAGAGLAVASVVVSWLVVHLTFTLRYARAYYGKPVGGVDFNDDAQPGFGDFAYLAFTIGMTFQVSDTSLTSSDMRAIALRHALLSYLFGAVIVAGTINLVAGLAK